jgi:hypothetical protein
MRLMRTEEDFRPPYSPFANGIVERANKEVLRHLRALMVCKEMLKGHWSTALPFVQRVLNSTPTTATGGIAPLVMLFGDRVTPMRHLFKRHYTVNKAKMEQPIEWLTRASEIHNRIVTLSRRWQDLHRRTTTNVSAPTFTAGDVCMLTRRTGKPGKLETILLGPYRVVKVTGKEAVLHDLVVGKEFDTHVRHMRPFVARDDIDDELLERLAAKTRSDDYVIERIVDHRNTLHSDVPIDKARDCEFFVHWAGHNDATWESFKTLKDTEALQKYIQETDILDV